MQPNHRILVVVNPNQENDLALTRARQIATITGASLHLLVCDRRNQYAEHLEKAAAELAAQGFKVSCEQSWRDSYHETIIQAQQSENCAMVIKQHFPENPLKRALLTPDDWKLLRYCPAPVLIVKSDQDWKQGTILAAVDVGNSGAEHRALHASLMTNAQAAVRISGAKLHVFSAYPAPMLSAADPTFQLRETIEARYREQAAEFINSFELDENCVHLQEGPADVLIPRKAKELGAQLTIVGTVARTGLSGALIGNTAEIVLDTLETDVLVVKPQNVMDHLENQLQR